MKFHLIAATALLVGSTAVLAQESEDGEERAPEAITSAQPQEEEALAEEDPGEEVVCRTERVTGSLTRRRRICMTRNEWAELEARTRDDMIRSGRQASGGAQCRQDQFGGC